MLCIWNYDSFKHIHDYDTWDKELCEDDDISRNIKNRSFVPLNLGDGAFEVEVRLCENNLSDREREYLLVPSQPYALNTSGTICVSGLEHVAGDTDENVETVKIKPGAYVIQANLIDWNQEPGAVDSDGNPTNTALPDMIVFITENGNQNIEYRTEVETFRKEDALR